MSAAAALAMLPSRDLWALAGRSNAAKRSAVMGALLGRKATQAESGVTMLRAEFYRQLGIAGDCEAARERAFRAVQS